MAEFRCTEVRNTLKVACRIYAFGHNGFGQIEPNGEPKISKPIALEESIMKHSINQIYATWRYTVFVRDTSVLLQGSLEPSEQHQSKTTDLPYIMKKLCVSHDQILVGLTTDHALVLSEDLSSDLTKHSQKKFEDIWTTHESMLVQESNKYYSILKLRGTSFSPIQFPLKIVTAVSQVVCGHSHTLILTADSSVYAYGNGTRGELGLGDLEGRKEPVQLEALGGLRVTQLSSGGWHNLALTESGDVYSWGWNESGQLGLESVIQVVGTPTLLPLQERDEQTEFKKVSCGSRHSCALTRDGRVYTWGWGEYGQLGHGDFISQSQPKPLHLVEVESGINGKYRIVNIIAGHWNTYIITEIKGFDYN